MRFIRTASSRHTILTAHFFTHKTAAGFRGNSRLTAAHHTSLRGFAFLSGARTVSLITLLTAHFFTPGAAACANTLPPLIHTLLRAFAGLSSRATAAAAILRASASVFSGRGIAIPVTASATAAILRTILSVFTEIGFTNIIAAIRTAFAALYFPSTKICGSRTHILSAAMLITSLH